MSADLYSDFVRLLEPLAEDRLTDDIAQFAQGYPRDGTVFRLSYRTLRDYDVDLADDLLEHPEVGLSAFSEVLNYVAIPIDMDLSGATVALTDLPNSTPTHPRHSGRNTETDTLLLTASSTA